MTTATAGDSDGNPIGPMLRGWRERRGLSQLELALRAESSARHLSFIETGRSSPSRAMVLRLAEHLDVPVRERNTLLVAAGYAPEYRETPLDDPAMAPVRESVERLLAAHEPYPALVVDGAYNVVAANNGILMLLDGIPEHLLQPPLNAMRLTLHPEGLARHIRNLREWRAHLIAQMDRQLSLARSPALKAVYDEVVAYPVADGGEDVGGPGAPADGVPLALPLRVEVEGQLLTFVSTIATFNTPVDITVSELAMETLLPADSATQKFLTDRS
ncbi:XRE family transcriptional regulator [Streptomyces sp. A7024]|uniref:XRE family transcriptional regulator n=1 Tax=Streptomyces coryli TaxID=1128680 RepID=A0A6G4U5S9_9ACTN|nr:helix-turn-helix transcriptional regulator [Streptomyces coryli]NGN67362.1 XRE family transcriptional regulator [Streptomyces coryli]